MSDVDPTPLTPVTLGDRLAWWRGDLKEQLATQHAELLAALAAQHAELLAAIQASASSGGATEATLAGIAAALGTTADCVTGETVIGLLCRLNDYVGGMPAGAPDPCMGYEGYTMYGPSAFLQATSSGEPTIYWFNGGEAFWTNAGFTVTDTTNWTYLSNPSAVSTVSPNMPVGQTIDCCVAVEVTGTVAGLSIDAVSGGARAQHQFISNDMTDDLIHVETTLTAGVAYLFTAIVTTGTPSIRMWITRKAIG